MRFLYYTWVLVGLICMASGEAAAQQRPPNFEKLITGADYPEGALDHRAKGTVSIRLSIEPSGAVGRCRVTFATVPASLANETCRLLKERARYSPAFNAAGKPVRSEDVAMFEWSHSPPFTGQGSLDFGGAVPVSGVVWPSDLDFPAEAADITSTKVGLSFAIGSDGKIVQCGIAKSGGHKYLDEYSCALVAKRIHFKMPVDATGLARSTRGRITINWVNPNPPK